MADQKFKSNVKIEAALNLAAQTAQRVPVLDASKNVVSSSVTDTELGYLSGVSSAIQTQLDAKAADNAVIKKDGSVAFTADQSMGGFKLTNLAAPSANGHALRYDELGAVNGIATLDGSGKVPSAQLPSYVDDVLEYANLAAFPVSGSTGLIYVALDTNKTYRWSGSAYIEISPSEVNSVNGATGVVVLDTDDISEGSTNLYFSDERAQDAVGTILADSSSIDFTYNDGTPSITAAVIPGGVDHDQLLNFVANEHIDHSAVSISAGAGLTGGGDITASRTLSVDINGTTAETSADNADKILIYDNSASALRSMTRANFLSGMPQSSAGDINETSFSLANNVASPANVTGLAFANATVRSFHAIATVEIDATADVFETFTLQGVQKGSGWDMSISAVGDDSGVAFTITSAGQVQYTSGNYSGFSSGKIKFRAQTLTVG